MSFTREKLYQEVWSRPMTAVAADYDVSSNYLARVCDHLNVPRPPRGYWAKLKVGKSPKPTNLPEARPGEVLEWRRGDTVPHSAHVGAAQVVEGPRTRDRASRHRLVLGVKEYFDAGRLSETGYLRPLKRNLVDIFVSRETLSYAL